METIPFQEKDHESNSEKNSRMLSMPRGDGRTSIEINSPYLIEKGNFHSLIEKGNYHSLIENDFNRQDNLISQRTVPAKQPRFMKPKSL